MNKDGIVNPCPVFWALIFPMLAFVAVPAINHYFLPGVVFTPACNFIVTAILSLRLKPWPMFFWAAAFLCSTLFVVMHPEYVIVGPIVANTTSSYIRFVGWGTGAVLAVLLSIHRAWLLKDQSQMLYLLRHMPVPFVVSSENGKVLFINEQASKLLNVTDQDVQGAQFFSLVEDVTGKKGTAVSRYLSVFDSKSQGELVSKLRPCANQEAILVGRSILVENAGLRRMVTVLSSENESRNSS